MISKPIEQIAEADFQALITNKVLEGRTLEYKRELPGSSDAEKKEFLADVSSFSNTAGGDLIFGLEEDKGAPTAILGVDVPDKDLATRRLESILASGLDPRLRYSLRVVDCAIKPVVIFRIEKSWIGPHRFVFNGHDKFYGRNSAGKYPLDVTELRNAFTLATGVSSKVRAFRTDRIIDIANNNTPMPMIKNAKLVLHIIPVEAFASQSQFNVLQFANTQVELKPMRGSGWSVRINLDGVISYAQGGGPNETVHSYVQLSRNGILEAVDAGLLDHEYEGRRAIPSAAYEQVLMQNLPKFFSLLIKIGVAPPAVVALTLTNVRGLEMGIDNMWFGHNYPIQQDTLILPEVWIEDFAQSPSTMLRPIFDLVWNAFGHPKSLNFDDQGNWVVRR